MAPNLPELNPNQNQKVDVQNTTFSIDALGRFICSTWDEATNPNFSAFDAVVIGSGMYGAYCAQRLWRQGKKVLVLEAGPFLVSEHVQNLARIGLNVPNAVLPESAEGSQTRELVWGIPWRGNQIFNGLAFCVGGKSLYWGGWSPRLTPDVLQDWPAQARDYLKDNYSKLEVQIGVAAQKPGESPQIETDFIDETGLTAALRSRIDAAVSGISTLEKSQIAPVAVQGQPPSSGLFSFDKYSSGPLLIDAIREDVQRSNFNDSQRKLFLVPRVRVLRLNAVSGTVNRIDVFDRGTFKSLSIPQKCKVVLAASCIESTRLALESFPTQLMGRNLMVHLRSNVAVRVPRSAFNNLPLGPLETAATHVPGKTLQGGRYHLQIVAGANPNGNAEEVWFRMIPDPEILQALLKNQDSNFIALQIRSCGEMVGIKDQGSPSPSSSWIDLSPFEVDEFGMRRAYVHLKTVPADEQLWNQMDEAMFALAESIAGKENTEYWVNGAWVKARPPFGKLNTEGGVRDPLGTTYHECGTLWMGDDPNSSVTDSTGRFHHITNAYCVDQSLFTRSGSANPVLTGLTLARLTAEAIANS